MTGNLNMGWPSAIIFCKRRDILFFGPSFVVVILYVAMQ
jgi:hypothetical protein